MAQKRNTPRKSDVTESAPQVTPMPFPGESPTVALAMAAGDRFGYHEEDKPAKAKPKRKASAKKKAAKPARKPKAAKSGRAKKSR